jgi:regulator of RNase E activity RraB
MGLFSFKKNKSEDKKSFEIKRQNWNFYSYTYGDNLTALIEFDVEFALEDSHQGYNSCKRIIIYIAHENCGPNGLAYKEENIRVKNLENELISALSGIDCKLTGKMSYGAMCDLNFQTNDSAGFMSTVSNWISNQKTHKIEIIEKDGWEFFDAKIKPNHIYWHQITDRRTIGTLIENGSNPEKEHNIEHSFLGEKETLQSLCDQLTSDGFTMSSFNDNQLVLMKPSKLVGGELSNLTQRLASYTASIGVKYDGWGAKIEK